jgi:hypothetical protein
MDVDHSRWPVKRAAEKAANQLNKAFFGKLFLYPDSCFVKRSG